MREDSVMGLALLVGLFVVVGSCAVKNYQKAKHAIDADAGDVPGELQP